MTNTNHGLLRDCALAIGWMGTGVAMGALAMVLLLPEHVLLVREGLDVHKWYPVVPSVVCPNGVVYAPLVAWQNGGKEADPCATTWRLQ